jgi:intracellular sulfur oxidation DsrE/DsrF family protein
MFVACEQTLNQQKIEKSEILPLSGFVPRGLVEVIQKQEQGWAYIKAGF